MLSKFTSFFRKNKSPDAKKKRVYLHVGMDKTGTSAIQAFLHKNRKELLSDNKILYPKTGMWNDFSHHPFAFSCLQMHGYDFDDFDSLCSDLCREVGEAESVLLSSECLFKLPTKTPGFEKFLSFINDNFSEVKVIIYLRRQDKWVVSRHKHSVISGQELPIEMLSKPHFCDYKQYIDKWAESFGKSNIIVKPYERSSFVGGDIFSDFLDTLGVKYSERYEIPDKTVNTALNNNEYAFKRLCNYVGLTGWHAAELNAILLEYSLISKSSEGNALELISDKEKFEIIHKYQAVNKCIAEEYLPNGGSELFSEATPKNKEPERKYLDIDNSALIEIEQFIRDKSPLLYKKLNKLCDAAINSESEETRDAAMKIFKNKN